MPQRGDRRHQLITQWLPVVMPPFEYGWDTPEGWEYDHSTWVRSALSAPIANAYPGDHPRCCHPFGGMWVDVLTLGPAGPVVLDAADVSADPVGRLADTVVALRAGTVTAAELAWDPSLPETEATAAALALAG